MEGVYKKMIQSHSLVLWRMPDGPDKESIERGFAILKALSDFGPEFTPNYVPGKRKRDAREFSGEFVDYNSLVVENMNKEGKQVFPDLGSTFSLFSSMTERNSAVISLTVGMVNSRFFNTLVINLPESYITDGGLHSPTTLHLFKTCVRSFEPFWGAVVNRKNVLRFGDLWAMDEPTTVHWMNYYGSKLAEKIGIERIQKAGLYRVEDLGEGLLLQSTEHSINDDSEDDLKQQKQFNAALFLS